MGWIKPVDALGVTIEKEDRVRVLSYGSPVRMADVGAVMRVYGLTRGGNVRLIGSPNPLDPVANGRPVPSKMLGVMRRDGGDGYEGNR